MAAKNDDGLRYDRKLSSLDTPSDSSASAKALRVESPRSKCGTLRLEQWPAGQWLERWFVVDGDRLTMFKEEQSIESICTIPLSYCTFRRRPKQLRMSAPFAFRIDIDAKAVVGGVRLTKLVLDPDTQLQQKDWLHALSENRAESEFVQKRRTISMAMHSIMKHQDRLTEYAESVRVKETIILLNEEVRPVTAFHCLSLPVTACHGPLHRLLPRFCCCRSRRARRLPTICFTTTPTRQTSSSLTRSASLTSPLKTLRR